MLLLTQHAVHQAVPVASPQQTSLPCERAVLFANQFQHHTKNDLCSCSFQAVALVQVLREHPVTSLNLAYNELGDTAAKAVAQLLTASNLESADELAVHAGLRELNLSSNRITAQGAIVIAEALAQPQCRLQVTRSSSTHLALMQPLQGRQPMHMCMWTAQPLPVGYTASRIFQHADAMRHLVTAVQVGKDTIDSVGCFCVSNSKTCDDEVRSVAPLTAESSAEP